MSWSARLMRRPSGPESRRSRRSDRRIWRYAACRSRGPTTRTAWFEFAAEVLRIVRRFNQEHGASLAAEVGINAGPVVGGIVGRSKFIYDLWGDTVNVARGIKLGAAPNSIIVTRNVKDRLRDTHEFESLGEVAVAGKAPIAAWVVKD